MEEVVKLADEIKAFYDTLPPEVFATLLSLQRTECAFQLIKGLTLLVAGIMSWVATCKLYAHTEDEFFVAATLFCFTVCAICSVCCVYILTDYWTWVGLVNPLLYYAHVCLS